MTETTRTIDWAAGLFEGEGCITFGKRNWELSLGMTDSDVVQLFRNTVGVGSVTGPIIRSYPNSKPVFMWRLFKSSDIQYVLGKLLPFFGNRRAYKALNTLDEIDEKLWK